MAAELRVPGGVGRRELAEHDVEPAALVVDRALRRDLLLRMAAEAPEIASVGIAWHQARIVSLHPNNFVYDSVAFDGDSGGAVVVARTGAVIGLHCELVNAARELIAHKEDVGERLNSIEESVKSLIRGSSSGCVGVRLDSAIVGSLLGRVE